MSAGARAKAAGLTFARPPIDTLLDPGEATIEIDAAPILRISLFGQMAVEAEKGRDVRPRVRKTRGVLAVLALAAPKPVLREELTGLLWSTRARPQARASLRQCVHELHEMLLPLGKDILHSDRTHLLLRTEDIWIDVRNLVVGGNVNLELLRGALLEDLVGLDPEFDRWLAVERRRISGLARAAAQDVLNGAAGPEAAIAAASRLVATDPADEHAWRALMAAHADRGDPSAAAAVFDRCGAALAACTGATPTLETRVLLDRIRHTDTYIPPAVVPRVGVSAVRLGVMPFRSLDGSQQDPLSLGLAEEITTALSRFRWISCIGSNSIARLADHLAEPGSWKEAVELDLLLDGTIQRAESRVRVNVSLLDMRSGGEVVWARRFDRDSTDLLALQDEIASETAAQVDPELLLREGSLAAVRPSADPSAYELTLRAIPAVYRLDRAGFSAAGEMLSMAAEMDPSYATAHAWLAYWNLFLVGQGWAENPEKAMANAEVLAEKAIALDPGDARALTLAGHVRAFLHRRVDEGIALHERALSLNPNLPIAWVFSSLAHTYAGRPDEGLKRGLQGRRLAPLDPHGFMADTALMLPHLVRREFGKVVEIGRQATGVAPGYSANWKVYLSALGHLSYLEQADAARRHLLRLEPGFTVQAAVERSPLLRAEDRATYAEGLKKAGLRD